MHDNAVLRDEWLVVSFGMFRNNSVNKPGVEVTLSGVKMREGKRLNDES